MIKNYLRHVTYLSSLALGILLCFSTQSTLGQTPPGYRLIWSDEFNGATIDASNWGFDIGGSGWGNNELQYYTNRPENAYLSNGSLVIEARKEDYGGRNYTSARLLTKGKRDFLFGRIDIRAKLPKGQGIWPALWSLGKNIDQVGWPACGEMDIMELLGHQPNKMYSTVHWAPPGGGSTNLPANYVLPSGDFTQDYHIFTMEWATDVIKFYVDEQLITTVTRANISGNYPFNDPFFLIFNVAVGGFWPGNPDETTTFPQRMFVDYVRVYQQNSSLAGPTVAAPTPTEPASRVVSLFSNAYTNVGVDTWSAPWDVADVTDVMVAGNATKKYTNLTFAGVEFHTPGPVIDATSMERFHADIWTPDASTFKLKLVDFGANGTFGGGDDTEHELSFSPTLGNWYSIDVPLSSFSGLASRAHLAQLIIVGDGGNKSVWVDNVYFYKLPPTEPTVAAPTPTQLAGNVKSLYSDAYSNLPVDTWSAPWDQADIEDVMVAGNATKKYSNLNYAGIEFHSPGPVIDASTMERFHLDVWTSNANTVKVKLVDFGANGSFGGGDDTEHELSFTPNLGEWLSIDVPLSDFANMTSKSHIAQLILVGGGGKTMWIDNVYFYRTGPAPTEPMVAAPTPTQPASNVISLFSNAYTNVAVDTWSAPWDMADVADVMIAGNATKKYSNLTFAGVEFHTPGPVVNATTMERFHADVWTANASTFKVKLVDFGANGTFGGGDDTEHELSFTPTLNAWFAIDVPLSNFTGMTSKAHIAQLILVGEGGGKTAWIDNVYFYKTTVIASEPTEAAPTPTQPASNVISLFSNAYTNVAVDTWSAPWDMADVADVMIAGNATKKYSNLTFAGVEFHTPGPVVNATTMERFHADVWTANASTFKVKLVDFGANGTFGGGDDTEHELSFTPTLGSWFSIDVPLSNFTGMTSKAHIAQLILVGDGGGKTAWIDNVYFYKTTAIASEPTEAAPTPTQPASNVISLFSNAYTNVAVDTWSAPWDVADVADVMIAGNATKKYSNLTFAGVEFHTPGPVVNATTMERFHADVWTANASTFKVKLVDFGANGTFGGGDDTEHELSFTPTLGSWFSIDVPLSNFTGMTSKAHIAQLILVGDGGGKTAWIDNVYFYKLPPVEPMVAAPTPTQPASNVISLFSNAYTNVAVDTWSAPWDVADVADVMIAGNATKKYSNLTFAGIEFHSPGPVVNATTMERFHADVWTANASTFKVKLVDFGANGTFGGGDDTEHELSFTPTLNSWFAIDVPLSDFTGMTSKAHIAQLILVGDGGGKTAWIDNVYFYRTTAPAPIVSLSPMGNCGTPVDFVGTTNCGAQSTVWYNASTNEALPTLPAKTPTVTSAYYARCKSAEGVLSDKSEVVTFTVISSVPTPIITVSQSLVCTGTTVTVSANCPAGSKAFWNSGVSENSFQVAFNSVTQQTYKAKCVFAGGCESAESNEITVRWKAFNLTFINIGQSKSAVKPSNNLSEWQNQLILPDGGPFLEASTMGNPTLYFAENLNKTAPRFWTIQVETCALGTNGSVTYDLLSTPETGLVRSYNTHENNAPYFMYGNRDGFTELYAQNHPAYGFYEDNGAGANVYDAGLPKGLYKLSVRYWDQKGWGSIYPATRKPQGNVLAYQEYWFRIQSKDGVGTGAARLADSGEQVTGPIFAAVLPNPVTKVLRLQVNASKGSLVTTTLLDASGRKIELRSFIPQSNTHQEEFDVNQLPTGMYFLNVATSAQQSTLKVLKVN